MARAIEHADWRDAQLSPRLRALGELAEKLSFDPHRVTAGDWKKLQEHGLDDEGCFEVAHIVGIFNHLTRLADGLGLRLDPQTLAAAEGGSRLERAAAPPAG